jgi:hypothetical protein
MGSDNLIKIGRSIHDLTGEGTEYLIHADGTIAARFYNGNFIATQPQGNTDPTVVPLQTAVDSANQSVA